MEELLGPLHFGVLQPHFTELHGCPVTGIQSVCGVRKWFNEKHFNAWQRVRAVHVCCFLCDLYCLV